MKVASLYGLVLAGGLSSRMGEDKRFIHFHGKPQQTYLFELLDVFCEEVFTSCRKEQEVSASLNPIHDKFDFESPLNGILSAFEQHPDKAWLAVAIDMPFVNEEVLQLLIANRDTTKVATCFYDSEGKLPEPLLTIWEPFALSALQKFTLGGDISPRDFLAAHDCKIVTPLNPKIHININTPEELRELKISPYL